MSRLALLAFATAVLSPSMAEADSGGGKIKWTKWKTAKVRSAASGLPIVVYAIVDAKGAGC